MLYFIVQHINHNISYSIANICITDINFVIILLCNNVSTKHDIINKVFLLEVISRTTY